MTGVSRGARVKFTYYRDDMGQGHSVADWRGTVLDRGPGAGEWWVMPSGAADRRAVLVKARDMQATVTQG